MRTPADLRPYQGGMVGFIVRTPRGACWVPMGGGKTVSTLTAIAGLHALGDVQRVLIVAPKRVAASVWHAEAAAWTHTRHLDFALCRGTATRRIKILNSGATVTVIGVDLLVWLIKHYRVKHWPFDTVVLDESSLFKNGSSKRFKALRMIARTERTSKTAPDGLVAVKSPIRRLIQLTGTPAANGLGNLWSQVALLDNGAALGRSETHFKMRFFWVPPGTSRGAKPRILAGAAERIHALVKPMVYVVDVKGHVEMPELVTNVIELDLPAVAREQYEELEREYLLQLEGGELVTAPNTAALGAKLLQIANGAVYVTDGDGAWTTLHDVKLDVLEEMADGPENLMVAYWFKHDLARLKARFPDAVTLADGDAEEIIRRWNAGEISMLLLHPAGAAHGLNLQFGGHVFVWFSMLYSLELHDQALARLARPGQPSPIVSAIYLTCTPIEAKVAKALAANADIQAALIEGVS